MLTYRNVHTIEKKARTKASVEVEAVDKDGFLQDIVVQDIQQPRASPTDSSVKTTIDVDQFFGEAFEWKNPLTDKMSMKRKCTVKNCGYV